MSPVRTLARGGASMHPAVRLSPASRAASVAEAGHRRVPVRAVRGRGGSATTIRPCSVTEAADAVAAAFQLHLSLGTPRDDDVDRMRLGGPAGREPAASGRREDQRSCLLADEREGAGL